MKCKNKHITINGFIQCGKEIRQTPITAIVTNDEIGKTLTLVYRDIGITIPFEAVEKYLIDEEGR